MSEKELTPLEQKVLVSTNQLIHLADLMSRARLAGGLAGVQYGGKRDVYAAAGYPAAGFVNYQYYWGLYTRGDIAGRIVDMPVKTTWKLPPKLLEIGNQETEFTEQFDLLAKRLKLWSYFQRVDRLAGIGRYAVMLLGTRGIGSDSELKNPLKNLRNQEDLLYLSVYSEEHAQIQEWVSDPTNPRFGLPQTYVLSSSNSSAFIQKQSLVVDASRVIHVAEDVLEDDTFGRPRLERVLNRLFDLEKVSAATGEAYWQQTQQILQAKIDKDVTVTDEQIKDMDEKLQEIIHDLDRKFTAKGAELSWLATQTPNVSQVSDFYFSMIAGASNVPKRILFGSELGQLASSQDQATYLGSISERQVQHAEPYILRPFVDRCIELGVLPQPKNGVYEVVWPPLFEDSASEIAEMNLKRAQTAQALTQIGGNPRELIRVTHEGIVELVERDPDEPLDLSLLIPSGTGDPNHPDPNAPPEAGGPAPSGQPDSGSQSGDPQNPE